MGDQLNQNSYDGGGSGGGVGGYTDRDILPFRGRAPMQRPYRHSARTRPHAFNYFSASFSLSHALTPGHSSTHKGNVHHNDAVFGGVLDWLTDESTTWAAITDRILSDKQGAGIFAGIPGPATASNSTRHRAGRRSTKPCGAGSAGSANLAVPKAGGFGRWTLPPSARTIIREVGAVSANE
jgi:hypothetical protein